MDRDAQVAAVRRRQALDALAFERDRAALLTEQLEERVAEVEGPRVDEAIFAQLSPDDVQLVRAALGDYEVAVDTDHEPWPDDGGSDASSEDANTSDGTDEDEDEIVRLQDELASSGRLQAALERYLGLL